MQDLRYPIGKFDLQQPIDEIKKAAWVQQIAALPQNLRNAVAGLSEAQLDTPYRPEGWTVRQVVHHVADSHVNCYCRFKFALAEDTPAIKAYDEQVWAELPEAKTGPVEISLRLVEALHARWHAMLEEMTQDDYQAAFRHPELGLVTLERALGLYAWHGNHHVAHITALRAREGW